MSAFPFAPPSSDLENHDRVMDERACAHPDDRPVHPKTFKTSRASTLARQPEPRGDVAGSTSAPGGSALSSPPALPRGAETPEDVEAAGRLSRPTA